MTTQEQLAIVLKPERVTVTAGGDEAQVIAQIQNQTSVIDSYTLEVTDLDPTWYTLPAKQVALFPNEQKTVNIGLRAPATFDTLAGRYDYSLRARSAATNRITQVAGVLFVALPEAISLKVKRDLIRGQEAKFEIAVSNRSKTPQTLTMAADDQEGMLEYTFDPPAPQLAPGATQQVVLFVRLVAGRTLVAERGFRFAVSAISADEREKSNVVQAQFVYVPGQIRLELLPARLKATEGKFNLNVSNPGINTMAVECALSAKDPDDVLDIQIQQRNLTLQPGTSIILPVTVRIRSGRKPELRPYPFAVSVRQGGTAVGATPAELGPAAHGEFVYEPPVEYGITVDPTPGSTPTNAQADYVVKLSNPSLIGLRLSLRAEDRQGALDLFFGSRVDQIVLPAGGETQVTLLVRLKGPPPTKETHYPFEISIHAIPDDGGSETDRTVAGDFVSGKTVGPLFRMDLLPPEAHSEIGKFQVRLTSGVNSPLQLTLRGRDDANMLQYEFIPQRIELNPGAVEVAELTVTPKDGRMLDTDFGHQFETIAWVPGMGTNGSTTQAGVWFYTPPAGPLEAPLTVQLTPTQVIGDTGQFTVTLANTGNNLLSVVLRGTDDAEALEFLFQVPRLDLQPKEVTEISLIVRGREGEPLPGPLRYPFQVSGWVPGAIAAETSIQYGEMVVTEALRVKQTWELWQRIAMAGLLVLWIALPFILKPLERGNPALSNTLQLVYQYLPGMVLPLLGVALYGSSRSEVRGWRGVLVGWLGFGSILTAVLPLIVPPGWGVYVNLILLPALIIVLLA